MLQKCNTPCRRLGVHATRRDAGLYGLADDTAHGATAAGIQGDGSSGDRAARSAVRMSYGTELAET